MKAVRYVLAAPFILAAALIAIVAIPLVYVAWVLFDSGQIIAGESWLDVKPEITTKDDYEEDE